MKQTDKITIVALVISAVGLFVSLLTGLINPFAASIVGIGILILAWMAWITLRVLALELATEGSTRKTIVLPTNSLPYTPYYTGYSNQIIKIDSLYKKIKIPATFLNWHKFTIIFWVEITEEFFHTSNHRYLLSYTTNVSDSSGHPNRFSIGLYSHSTEWQFAIKGNDPKNETKIKFSSSHNLLGWKLFSIRWEQAQRKLDFCIDAGHVFQNSPEIPPDYWPQYDPKCQFHLGGWQDNWPGGLSELRFYNFRVYERYLSNGDLETVLGKEGELLRNA